MSPLDRSVRAALACAFVVAPSLLGCGGPEYDRTDITDIGVRSLGGRTDQNGIQVPSGAIVTAHVVSYNDENKPMKNEIRSLDPTIVDVAHIVSDHDFAFIGMKPGRTQLEIRADDRVVFIIDAITTEQTPVP